MPYQQTEVLLQGIEQELKQLQMWSPKSPAPQALASTAPFACDRLPLEQWLQFILVPKMQQLLRTRQPLPSKIAIAPMAQYVWAEQPETRKLITLLEMLDDLLSGQ
ncbi:YqcC family protein [Shewanella sp. YIC-542]|uniref:YqcC family protein n=1 Tax=Shewanella mytili TaxID=3377111 RepID=UPI00398E41CE